MTYQSNPQRLGFRELTPAELFVVSGGGDEEVGEIVVTGSRGNNFTSISAESLASLGIFGFSDGGFLGLGGGFLDSLFGGGGGEPFVTVSLEDEDLDGDGEPGITVTPPPIQAVYAGADQIYVRLFNNGEFIEYARVYDPNFSDYYVFFSLPDFEPIANGTYTATFNQPSVTFSIPPSIGVTSPSVSYTFTYEP